MIEAKRATIIEHNGKYEVKCIKAIRIIDWHERNKQLISYELMCKNGKAIKLKEDGVSLV
jgi:hypothetical protein